MTVPDPQEQFDEAMFDFSMADYDSAITKLEALLVSVPDHFDARLALGMAFCRKGDFTAAIREGHQAEKLRPQEQLVHTNLSLFYMKAGDKKTAEHHGLQARLASWRNPDQASVENPDLAMSKPAPAAMKFSGKLPATPWKKNKPVSQPPPTTPPPARGTPDADAHGNHDDDPEPHA